MPAAPHHVMLFFGVAAVLLECLAVWLLLEGRVVLALALHVGSSASLGFSLYLLYGRDPLKARLWLLLGGGLSLLVPAYGTALVLVLLAALKWVPPPPGDLLSEFMEHTAPQDESSRRMRAGDLPLVDHLQVEPLIDMLETPDVEMKRAVIDAMARRRGKKLIACIQGCLQDPRPEIYQYAMARLARLQEDFTRDIGRARQEADKDPDSVVPRYRLARIYEEYLESGLVDATLVSFYRAMLLEAYEAVLALAPSEITAALARSRLLIEMGRTAEAALELLGVIEQDIDNIEARFLMVQVFYAHRAWRAMQSELGSILRLSATRNQSQSDMLDLAQWMLNDSNEAELPSEEEALGAPSGPVTRLGLPAIATSPAAPNTARAYSGESMTIRSIR
jgi:hypothetical protein